MLKKIWANSLKLDWKFGFLFILVIGIPRFIIVLQANVTGNFNFQGIIFFVMWLLPFIFLSKKGRKYIGIVKINNWKWFFYSILIGAIVSSMVFGIGYLLYKNTYHNWFVYIGRPFEIANELSLSDRRIFFYYFFCHCHDI